MYSLSSIRNRDVNIKEHLMAFITQVRTVIANTDREKGERMARLKSSA